MKLLNTYKFSDFEISKGDGSYLYTKKGQKLLDFSAGVAVNSLGYNHPVINQAMLQQVDVGITHLSGSQLHKYKIQLSEQISKNSNRGDVFFSNSGAESIETAIKIARFVGSRDNKDEIVAMSGSFHGRTLGALSLGSNKTYKTDIGPVPGKVKFVKFNDIEDLYKQCNNNTIAIILECIQGDGGINISNEEFTAEIQKICNDQNIILIADEIQGGMGRSGKLFSYQHYNLKPDIITLAKGLGGGIPIGATVVGKKLSKYIMTGFHGSTFGGGMLQTNIASKVFDTINSRSFLKDVQKKSDLFDQLLSELAYIYPKLITDIRIKGLMIGMQIRDNQMAKNIFEKLLKNGLITTLIQGNTIRITPPLVISEEEIELGVEIIKKTLSKI